MVTSPLIVCILSLIETVLYVKRVCFYLNSWKVVDFQKGIIKEIFFTSQDYPPFILCLFFHEGARYSVFNTFFLEYIFYLCYGFFSPFFIFILNLNEKDPLIGREIGVFSPLKFLLIIDDRFRGNY